MRKFDQVEDHKENDIQGMACGYSYILVQDIVSEKHKNSVISQSLVKIKDEEEY